MKKLFLLFMLVLSCKNQDNKLDASFDSSNDLNQSIIVLDDNWKLDIPNSWQERPLIGSAKFIAENKIDGVILLYNDNYPKTFTEFAIEYIRDLRNQGSKILLTNPVTINNQNFIHLKYINQDILVDSWISIKNSKFYILECGGKEVNKNIFEEDCNMIFNSLKLK